MLKKGRKKGVRMVFLQTYLPAEVVAQLKARAEKEFTTVSQLVRKILTQNVNE